jgi:polyribonucleotide nucleotidyltransferase
MLKELRQPREELSPNAPRLLSLQIPVDKIGAVIGPAGRNIRALQEDYEVKISIEDTGMVTICGVNGEKVDACIKYLQAMTAEVEVGTVYTGRVTSIKEFGAFIEILPSQEGLCHVSELSDTFIRSVTDVVRIGDEIEVKVIGIDDFGKVKLSRKALLVGDDSKPSEGDRGRDRDRGRGDRDRGGDRSRGRSEEERDGDSGPEKESQQGSDDPVTVVGELEEPGQLLKDSGSPAAPEQGDRSRRRSRRPRPS